MDKGFNEELVRSVLSKCADGTVEAKDVVTFLPEVARLYREYRRTRVLLNYNHNRHLKTLSELYNEYNESNKLREHISKVRLQRNWYRNQLQTFTGNSEVCPNINELRKLRHNSYE